MLQSHRYYRQAYLRSGSGTRLALSSQPLFQRTHVLFIKPLRISGRIQTPLLRLFNLSLMKRTERASLTDHLLNVWEINSTGWERQEREKKRDGEEKDSRISIPEPSEGGLIEMLKVWQQPSNLTGRRSVLRRSLTEACGITSPQTGGRQCCLGCFRCFRCWAGSEPLLVFFFQYIFIFHPTSWSKFPRSCIKVMVISDPVHDGVMWGPKMIDSTTNWTLTEGQIFFY